MPLRIKLFRYVLAVLSLAAVPAAATDVGTELRLVYRAQAPDGALALEGQSAFYDRAPLLATMAVDECRRVPDNALASQSAAAITRYYDYLFGTYDRDRDLLVETTTRDAVGNTVEVEDIGYNALLSIDMLNLAWLDVEVRRPYRALYWYHGARLVQDAIVHNGFDADANFFFPRSAAAGTAVLHYRPLSAMPLLFPGIVGDNHATAVIREYLLNPTQRVPRSPFDALGGPSQGWVDDATTSMRLLETVLLLEVLESHGFTAEAKTFRDQAVVAAINDLADAPGGGSAHHRYLVDRLEQADPASLHPTTVALDVFTALVHAAGGMSDADIVRLDSAVENTRRWLALGDDEFTATDATAAEMAVRTVYLAVSWARERLADKSLFSSEAYRATGTDPNPAMERVLDDVIDTLRDLDNRIFRQRFHSAGLQVTPTLLRDRTVAGRAVEVKWTIGAHNHPLTLREAIVTVGDESAVLADSDTPIELTPGETQTLRSRFIVTGSRMGSLEPVVLTLGVESGQGERARFHALRSVYVEHPVEVSAVFDAGRMLHGSRLPIDVVIRKKSDDPAVVGFEWFSPTGLHLAEGRAGQYTMKTGEDSVSLALNVVVPSPCRPGRFPFKIKFYANGSDLGLISSHLFKPYQWLFAGPFEAGANPMATVYPPQKGINVLDTYDGARGSVGWNILGNDVYGDGDEIELRRLMARPGVGFFHTVIETEFETAMPVLLSSNAPTDLFVNGEPVLHTGRDGSRATAYARVSFTRGTNDLLIKVAGDRSTRLSFHLGDENSDATYTFNNDLGEILDGYQALVRRNRGHGDQAREAQKVVTLRYQNPSAQSVAVIGTFNGWSPDNARMRALNDGTWEIVLTLPPGRYAYRFLVDNREQVLDPNNDAVEADGFGGKNSVIVVE